MKTSKIVLVVSICLAIAVMVGLLAYDLTKSMGTLTIVPAGGAWDDPNSWEVHDDPDGCKAIGWNSNIKARYYLTNTSEVQISDQTSAVSPPDDGQCCPVMIFQ